MTRLIPKPLIMGFGLAITVVIVNGWISYHHTNTLVANEQQAANSQAILNQLEQTLSTVKDAEIGQRSYLLTGESRYLIPYQTAITAINHQIRQLRQTVDAAAQQQQFSQLHQQVDRKLDALQTIVPGRQQQDQPPLSHLGLLKQGETLLQEIQQVVTEMKTIEQATLTQKAQESQASIQQTTTILTLVALLNLGLLALLYYAMRRNFLTYQQTQMALRQAKDELEQRVSERTAELSQINHQLQTELDERRQVQEALRISQARFVGILDIAGDAIISIDANQRITLFNQGAEQIFGYSAQDVIGQSLDLLIPLRFMQAHRQHVNEFNRGAVQSRQMGERREIWGRRKDGTEFPAEASISKLNLEDGITFTVILRDITDRKQVERMKKEFVSIVSHELRTPLASIHGSLGMLTSGLLKADSAQGKRLLEIAADSTDRLVCLINDILDIEWIESDQARMERVVCELTDLIKKAVDRVQPLADKANITLLISCPSIQLWVDPDRIVQTLVNLLSNAIKFSPTGNTVWLEAMDQSADSPQNPTILVSVKDQGQGIPADKLDRIFDRFQQVDSSDSRNHDGTGLGLAICRSIVQQHDGQIWVESVLGKGSTFYFTLPIRLTGLDSKATKREHEREQQTLKAPQKASQFQQELKDQKKTQPIRVLLVEDDRALANLLMMRFEQHDMIPFHATTGREAIHLSQQVAPDLLILDIILPEEDGFTVVEWLQKHDHLYNTPLLVYSAKDLSESERNRLKLGDTEFLTKGRATLQEFEQCVMALLHKSTNYEVVETNHDSSTDSSGR